jgi:putative addiction module killer protein
MSTISQIDFCCPSYSRPFPGLYKPIARRPQRFVIQLVVPRLVESAPYPQFMKPLAGHSFIDDNEPCTRFATTLPRTTETHFLSGAASSVTRRQRIAIDRRINRVELGNFGDHKFCRDGVWELRIDVGPGYRVYYAIAGSQVILLLCAGDKRTQASDIARACEYWQDWQGRAE